MAVTTEQILIEFITDDSQLQPVEDRLEHLGVIDKQAANQFKATNAELAKRTQLEKQLADQQQKEQQIVNKLVSSLKVLSGESKKAVETLLRLSPAEIAAGFEQAAISVDEYLDVLRKTTDETKDSDKANVSLRKQLRDLTEQLQKLKLEGKDNTKEFEALRLKAGQIKDAMADASQEIKNAGSDTRTLDNVVGSLQAVAAGAQLVQGTMALVGDENEDLQKTLVRLNAIMAITQGLQQLQNALQKEGALIKLADQIQTKGQIALQTIYAFVVGKSTGALKAFRIALAATGVGLLILGLGKLISLMENFSTSAEDAAKAQERLNAATQNLNETLVNNNKLFVESLGVNKKALQDELALAEARGAKETELNKLRIKLAQEERSISRQSLDNLGLTENAVDRLQLQYDGLTRRLNVLAQVVAKDPSKETIEAAEENAKRIKAEMEAIRPLLEAGRDALQQQAAATQELAVLQIKQAQLLREQRAKALDDELAALERKLLATEKNSQEEINLQIDVLRKKAQIELLNDELTINQRKLIEEKAEKEILELRRSFLRELTNISLQNIISENTARLAQVDITEQERLQLVIDNLNAQAQIEIQAAENNASKIKEINAKRDQQIREAKLESIKKVADEELRLQAAENAPEVRRLQRVSENANAELRVRIQAIDDLNEFEIQAIDVRLAALQKSFDEGLISYREYNASYEELTDQQVKLTEDAEKKKQDLIKASADRQREIVINTIRLLVDIGNQLVGLVGTVNESIANEVAESIKAQRAEVQKLREANAITEKEEKKRLKQIEAEEQKARTEQARREKQQAVFKAILAIPQAFLQGLATGGPILGAIYAGLAAIQATLIASRPVPKFSKGKKDKYRGPGWAGEAGAEIVDIGGQMYLVKSPQLMWFNPEDKVYTPAETKQMLYENKTPAGVNGYKLDYDKFGEAVAKHIPEFGLNIDEDGFTEYQRSKQEYTKYLNNRRGY